ncbi:MAG: hypothetical protein JNJ71_07330 [Rubrivivax sp.]|nr:hypothetical protein [Rubrivivax sp.]
MTLAAVGWSIGWALQNVTGLSVALVLLSPLIGFALAPLLGSLLGHSVDAMKAAAIRDIDGQHYEYKGRPLVVVEDLQGDRWIQIKGLRSILRALPRDEVLLRIAAEDVARGEGSRALLFRAQGLNAYLQRNQDDNAVRFRNWLQREVIFPAEKAKRRNAAVAPMPPAPGP